MSCKAYSGFTKSEAEAELASLRCEYEAVRAKGLKLDMSRGKPCSQQLDLSAALLDNVSVNQNYFTADNVDVRNYGVPYGIKELRGLFGELLNTSADKVIVCGVSSLNIMFDFISNAFIKGLPNSKMPWAKENKIKFICPAPGYDRHFKMCEHFGIEMIAVPFDGEGPDMDMVEKLVAGDESIKGIWCVPMYSNPTGTLYSEKTTKRLASMKCAAKDFVIMWDDAYCVHNFGSENAPIFDLLGECERAGNPNRAVVFASTSKITYAGAGVTCICLNNPLLGEVKEFMSVQTIGHDKINQLRHFRFLKSKENIISHMEKHAAIIKPKFEKFYDIFQSELGDLEIASWSKPSGGYFINLITPKDTAKKIITMCAEAGVTLTSAGAAFPYGKDPEDCNIRIAPTYPSLEEIEQAAVLICVCTKISSLEKAIAQKQ
ncbi:MAG: aminotransferase class I/II-fold pyridoxal phosphate-dependent enzyme [Oscillospiraceae bacterium]